MTDLIELLKDDPALYALINKKSGVGSLSEPEEMMLLSASFIKLNKTMVIVKPNLYTAQQLYYRVYPLLKQHVLLFTMEESLRVEAVAASPNIYAEQMDVLTTLCLSDSPKLVITHPMALMRYLPSKEVMKKHIINLKVGNEMSMDELKQLLIESGYRQTVRVDQPLTFSLRGDVIDVFSIQNDHPIRIEFFDTEIDSLRYFDISTQKTIERIDQSTIVPASVLIYDEDFEAVEKEIKKQLLYSKTHSDNYDALEENVQRDINYLKGHIYEHYLYRYACFFNNTSSLLEYMDDPYVLVTNTEDTNFNIENMLKENNDYIRELFTDNKGLNYYSLFNDFNKVVDNYKPYEISTLNNLSATIKSKVTLTYFPLLPLDKMVDELVRLSKNNKLILCVNKMQEDLLKDNFDMSKLNLYDYVEIQNLDLVEGFNYEQYIILTAKELFGVKSTKSRFDSKFKEAIVLDSYQDLKINDYVVHNTYGVGKYEGIITKEIQGRHRDYLQIRYKDDDMLLVPLEQFKLVRKFVAAEGVGIRLNKLGSNSWNKTKEKIQNEVNDIAERLIKLYSEREENIGYAFSKDDEYSEKFEKNFPYQLTSDQQKAIAEVKYDMEQPRPMDRLLCGDVGFGKTEVAMVAAFKAVKDCKQVAYLCPTTILSMQHYNSFVERFKGFPVKIRMLNRYVLESQVKQTLNELQRGEVDIVIGTHRLLSNDVHFEDLGLLIIDEEQRFGVQAKEKIKELKKSIDVLSLSATPIPRTLQMSLIGVMSLSQLETAPKNRMPVQTYVVEKNNSLVKEVIQRELSRNGQVFYLHNNVDDIYDVARKIHAMVPNASVGVGHGKMNREEIEDVMYRFVMGEYDVLVCTTIIETGIDIPNANTIIIENAENFGLSQLYQIRGRVGRSDKVAYAYLMYRNSKQLSEVATKRLQAIKDFTELGSGYKIAMRDLTIRGAGDLLGERQAGFINTVGMNLYIDMLNAAINSRKGISQEIVEVKNKVNEIDGYIPEKFVNEDYEKLTIYHKLAEINSLDELLSYYDQLADYYGKLPATIEGLFDKKKMELMLNNERIEKYEEFDKENRITLSKSFSDEVDGVKLFEQIGKISAEIKLRYTQGRIILHFDKKKNYLKKVYKCLEVINKL